MVTPSPWIEAEPRELDLRELTRDWFLFLSACRRQAACSSSLSSARTSPHVDPRVSSGWSSSASVMSRRPSPRKKRRHC